MKPVFVLLAFSCCALSAQPPVGAPLKTAKFPDEKAGWTPLFNGRDLSGWHQLNGKAKYTVSGGVITGETVAGEPNSFLATDKEYGDFILELEYHLTDSMNSGIQIRSESTADYNNGRVHGYQMEIDPSPRAWSGGLYDEARRGWLYPMEYNPAAKSAWHFQGWNKYRIECIGSSIRCWVNGIPTSNVVDDMTLKGFIALQVHAIGKGAEAGHRIQWRNIRIKTTDLHPTPPDNIFVVNLVPNDISTQELSNGYNMLFDGKGLAGWHPGGKNGVPQQSREGWSIADGALTEHVQKMKPSEPTKGGDLVSDKTFGPMILQFDFKLTEGANSGVKYFAKDANGGVGAEYQVLDDEHHPDAKAGEGGDRTLASLYDMIASDKIAAAKKKIGEWNHGMVIVFPDGRVQHWLNGYKVVDYVRGSADYMARFARSKFSKLADYASGPKGHILLQDHGDQVWFRGIKVKEL